MERMVKVLSVALLASCFANAVTPYLNYRSQGQDMARLVSGTTNHVYKTDVDSHNFYVSLTPEYTRSFDAEKIGSALFGEKCKKALTQGTFEYKPVIQNFNAELQAYWGMDKWVKGLFFRAYAPVTYTKWNLDGKFTAGDLTVDELNNYFCKAEVVAPATEALKCSRFCACADKGKWGVADVHADLGWNFLLDQDYHLGLFVHATAPTGSKVKGEYLFQPVVGNGRHFELGGGLTGAAVLWRNEEENKHFSFNVEGIVSHLFNAKQNRVFDLVEANGGALSRYFTAANQVTDVIAPIANLTSCRMKVNANVQVDAVAMFNYTTNNWSFDAGYNFWMRSCEKFDSCKKCCDNSSTCTPSCCGSCIIKNGSKDWYISNDYSTDPVVYDVNLTTSLIDEASAKTKGLSNKVFGNISYAWMDREIVPSLSLGGFAEFGKNDSCKTSTTTTTPATSATSNKSCCKYASLSQWGLWLKGGLTF